MSLLEYLEHREHTATHVTVIRGDQPPVEEIHPMNPQHLMIFRQIWTNQYYEFQALNDLKIKGEERLKLMQSRGATSK